MIFTLVHFLSRRIKQKKRENLLCWVRKEGGVFVRRSDVCRTLFTSLKANQLGKNCVLLLLDMKPLEKESLKWLCIGVCRASPRWFTAGVSADLMLVCLSLSNQGVSCLYVVGQCLLDVIISYRLRFVTKTFLFFVFFLLFLALKMQRKVIGESLSEGEEPGRGVRIR